mmetsp:Transcript_13432/g.39300  ORF Transcript_13432/g.39300 Transcript_13432/m.39300 type:complete len:308 (+) Transcript_13432:239-1162(+)
MTARRARSPRRTRSGMLRRVAAPWLRLGPWRVSKAVPVEAEGVGVVVVGGRRGGGVRRRSHRRVGHLGGLGLIQPRGDVLRRRDFEHLVGRLEEVVRHDGEVFEARLANVPRLRDVAAKLLGDLGEVIGEVALLREVDVLLLDVFGRQPELLDLLAQLAVALLDLDGGEEAGVAQRLLQLLLGGRDQCGRRVALGDALLGELGKATVDLILDLANGLVVALDEGDEAVYRLALLSNLDLGEVRLFVESLEVVRDHHDDLAAHRLQVRVSGHILELRVEFSHGSRQQRCKLLDRCVAEVAVRLHRLEH